MIDVGQHANPSPRVEHEHSSRLWAGFKRNGRDMIHSGALLNEDKPTFLSGDHRGSEL